MMIPPLVRFRGASREEAAVTGICMFLALYAFAFAFARFTPESIAALGANTLLASHDFTVPLFFWGTLLAMLCANRGSLISKTSCVIASMIVGYLTLHTVPSQLDASVAWVEYHRELDVAGAGMVMNAQDPKFLFALLPEQKVLDYHRSYMQQHRLSFFADERVSRIGSDLRSAFGEVSGGCGGLIDRSVPAGPGIFRVEGFVKGPGVKFPLKSEIVLTNAAGEIDGIGNTLVISEKRGGQDFVAYAESAAVGVYIITPERKACRFGR